MGAACRILGVACRIVGVACQEVERRRPFVEQGLSLGPRGTGKRPRDAARGPQAAVIVPQSAGHDNGQPGHRPGRAILSGHWTGTRGKARGLEGSWLPWPGQGRFPIPVGRFCVGWPRMRARPHALEAGALPSAMDTPPPVMDAPPPKAAPPTVPGAIPDPRDGRLPLVAKVVAWLGICFGLFMLSMSVYPPSRFDPYGVAFGVFLPLGIGVLLRSNIARILARLAHGLLGLMLLGGVFFSILGLLSGGGQSPATTGGLVVAMVGFLLVWTLGLAAFFVWGFFVLGRADVRRACQRPRP